ncbi:MAG TPA: GxxExxY protein [Acidobacteriota bacterium]|jgi:GxxExxY protein
MTEELKHKELTGTIIGAFFDVYNELGHGFLESVYEASMGLVLSSKGLEIMRQAPLPVWFREQLVGDFRADLLVERKIIVEIKAARALDPANEAQILNYLRASEIEIGMLINFGPKPEFKRMIFENSRKKIRTVAR